MKGKINRVLLYFFVIFLTCQVNSSADENKYVLSFI